MFNEHLVLNPSEVKKLLGVMKRNEMIIPEWLFRKLMGFEKKNLSPLWEIARFYIKLDDKQLTRELATRMINP